MQAAVLENSSAPIESERSPKIDPSRVPKHVAIIMDGNRRWAKRRGLSSHAGHFQGVSALSEVVESALYWGVSVLTVYAFSTENWARSIDEVRGLFELIGTSLSEQCAPLCKQGVSVHAIGNLERVPVFLRDQLAKTVELTSKGSRLKLVLAINYGGRDDICRAMRRVVGDCMSGKRNVDGIDETLFGSYLDTGSWSDPELCIRTSGEFRVSNFLLWQLAYSEMVFADTLWPDFTKADFVKALEEYQTRQRRFGVCG